MSGSLKEGIATTARMPIDKKRIVEVALELLNKEGLDQLSMRRLADLLGIRASSLYWHVKDKAALIQLLADKICELVPLPGKELPWQQKILSMSWNYRNVLLSIRDSEKILLNTAPATPKRFEFMESTFKIFADAGFPPEEVVSATSLLNNFVLSFVSDERRFINSAQDQGKNVEEMLLDFRQMLLNLPDKYPIMISLADYITTSDMDKQFQFGLQILVDGLTIRLKNNT